MNTGEMILNLRTQKNWSQDELAEKVFVTRQAVSRWENGDTTPNIDTLKLLSKLFDVSINTLLGSPRQLICQCCGMPLDDSIISRETDGQYNEDYCKWCYSEGKYAYSDLNTLIDFCAKHMADKDHSEEQIRSYLSETLPKLDHWKRYAEIGGKENLDRFKINVIEELNALKIDGMPTIDDLDLVSGSFANPEYLLSNGTKSKFLIDREIYLGKHLDCIFGGDRYFKAVAGMGFLLVATFDINDTNPELVVFRKR